MAVLSGWVRARLGGSAGGQRATDPPADQRTGVARREEVVQIAIDTFRRHPFREVSLASVASDAGLDLHDVTVHFPTMDDLIVTTVGIWNTQRLAPLLPVARQSGAVAFLRGALRASRTDPALLRLMTAAMIIAATPEHPKASALQREWLDFQMMIERTLAHDIEVGRESSAMEPARGAEQLIAIYEGLEVQSMVRRYLDPVDAYDRAIGRFRHGWSVTFPPPATAF